MEQNTKIHQENHRDQLIDSVKGVGILLVVIGHHLLETEPVIKWIYSFHMPLFFIISGILSVLRYEKGTDSLREYVARKARTLLYPYVTFSLLNLLWYLVFHVVAGANAEETLQVVVIKMVTTYGYHALWFLPVMFVCSVVTYAGKRIIFRPTVLILLAVAGALLAMTAETTVETGGFIHYSIVYIGRILIAITFWRIGRYLQPLLWNATSWKVWCMMFAAFGISLLGNYLQPITNLSCGHIGNPLIYYPTACAGSIAVILACKLMRLDKSKLLTFWGRNSLVVLATHMDIPIEIAWICLGASGIAELVPLRAASVAAIAVELLILYFAIKIISGWTPWMLIPRNKLANKD